MSGATQYAQQHAIQNPKFIKLLSQKENDDYKQIFHKQLPTKSRSKTEYNLE